MTIRTNLLVTVLHLVFILILSGCSTPNSFTGIRPPKYWKVFDKNPPSDVTNIRVLSLTNDGMTIEWSHSKSPDTKTYLLHFHTKIPANIRLISTSNDHSLIGWTEVPESISHEKTENGYYSTNIIDIGYVTRATITGLNWGKIL